MRPLFGSSGVVVGTVPFALRARIPVNTPYCIPFRAAQRGGGRAGVDRVHALGAARGRHHRRAQGLRALAQVAGLLLAGQSSMLHSLTQQS